MLLLLKLKNIANTQTPDKNPVTPVVSPELRENPSDDFDDSYTELNDDIIDEIHAMKDTNVFISIIESRAVKYK